MKKQTSLITLSLLLATPALAGGAGAPAARPGTAACQTIAQIVANDAQFSTLLTAVQAAGLTETLASGQYTVFAPTNAAFAKLPSDQLAAVLNDEEMLRSVLLYHVVPGKVSSQQVRSLRSAKTAQGANVTVAVSGSRVTVGGATVTRADVAACNGVIHVIDTVLMPPMAAATPAPAPAATTPAPAAPAASTPAPAPAAFDIRSIPATPLSGGATTTTTTTTTTTETATTTGTATTEAATTDTATTTETTATDTAATAETVTVATNTLYDVIVADARFSTLLDLLSDAGLTETLTTGEFTVFAPTNEAFAALDEATLANLAANPDVLRQVLSYHVVQGRLTAEQLATGTTLNSVQGGALPLSRNGDAQLVGTATVSETLTTPSNGTIFVINQVLLPPGLTIPAAEAVEAAPADAAATATETTTTTAPAATTPAPATAPESTTASATNATNLATLIATDARFSTLAGLLQTAGLTETLTTGEFTIFAPTNEAFAKLAPADLTALGADAARLRAVLLYHVVPGRITATALASSPELTSVETGRLTLTRATGPDRTTIGTATTAATIAAGEPVTAGNGLLYVIDTVLTPPAR